MSVHRQTSNPQHFINATPPNFTIRYDVLYYYSLRFVHNILVDIEEG